MLNIFKKKPAPKPQPPVPHWRPSIEQPIDTLVGRMTHYSNGKFDFVIFRHGTGVSLPDGLSDQDAGTWAIDRVRKFLQSHPDVHPTPMTDGNIVVASGDAVAIVVLEEVTQSHWSEIDRCHQQALCPHEVLITPNGPNTFDDFGKKVLFGRCFLFMDAIEPVIARIVRKTSR